LWKSDQSSRRFKVPHVFALLTGVIFVCSLLTWVLPAGNYQREVLTVGSLERTVVIPDSYQTLKKNFSLKGAVLGDKREDLASPVSLVGFLSAIPRGMERSGEIIFFIFILGGVFGILQRTGAIVALLNSMQQRFRNSSALLTVVLMTAIAVGGSTLGMGEEFIPLVPIFLIASKQMGYDRIYGLALVFLAAEVGFAAATTNPFTVNIAQGIAELPLNSAIPFRVVFFLSAIALSVVYVLRYGARIAKDPSASFMTGDSFDLAGGEDNDHRLDRRHLLILGSCAVIFVLILGAVQSLGWWLAEMAGGFMLMGFVAVLISRIPAAEAVRAAVQGMEEMVVAALVVGFARGVQVVLDDAQVLDTLIHSAAVVLQLVPTYLAAEGMLLFQATLNFFVPSGSGQAAVTMPLMVPLADVLGLPRQVAVFAFTCGDGFSNTVIPTSGVLMAMLSLAKIPYDRWLRFMFPLFLQLMALSAIFLAIAVAIDLN
jgi:uncharacterized ion transporter superfamily protein YfcC